LPTYRKKTDSRAPKMCKAASKEVVKLKNTNPKPELFFWWLNGESGWAVDPNNANLIRFGGQAKLGLFGLDSNSVTQILRKYWAAGKKIFNIFCYFFFSETEYFFRFSFVSLNFVSFRSVSEKIRLIPFCSVPFSFVF
jgi:hypothetical protein